MATPIVLDIDPPSSVGCQEMIDNFIRDAMIRLPGAIEEVVKHEIRSTLREFFEKSISWRRMEGPYDVKAGRPHYYLNPVDSYTHLVYVLSAYYNGNLLAPLRVPPVRSDTGTPYAFFCPDPQQIQLYPTPDVDATDALTIHIALTPSECTDKLPKIAITHFYDAILDGILYRMYIQPSKPYSNPELALHHQRLYRMGTGKARIVAEQGYMVMSPSVPFPPFANG